MPMVVNTLWHTMSLVTFFSSMVTEVNFLAIPSPNKHPCVTILSMAPPLLSNWGCSYFPRSLFKLWYIEQLLIYWLWALLQFMWLSSLVVRHFQQTCYMWTWPDDLFLVSSLRSSKGFENQHHIRPSYPITTQFLGACKAPGRKF